MPAPTVKLAEARLIARDGRWMALADMSVAPSFLADGTPTTPNPFTLTAISDAAGQLGVDVIDGAPTDASLAGFDTPTEQVKFRELAELALLEEIVVNQPALASSSSTSESFESHTITQSQSNSSSTNSSSLAGKLDYLRKKYAAFLNPSLGGVRAGDVSFRYPTPRRRGWGLGCGRIDH